MKCSYPYDIEAKGRKYTVPCGRCHCCRINITDMWRTRLIHELRTHKLSSFITLTYNNKYHPADGNLNKRHLQLFFKRVRAADNKVRYFACGEYGGKHGRAHYHAIVFGFQPGEEELRKYWSVYLGNDKDNNPIYENMGRVHIGTVTPWSIGYCAGYVQKKIFKGSDRDADRTSPFSLMSRRPGLGGTFINKYLDIWHNHGYINVEGKKKPIPRYYTGKLSEEARIQYAKGNVLRHTMNILKGNPEGLTQRDLWNKEYDEREQRELNARKKTEERR